MQNIDVNARKNLTNEHVHISQYTRGMCQKSLMLLLKVLFDRLLIVSQATLPNQQKVHTSFLNTS